MEFKASLSNNASLLRYLNLFRECFPSAKHYSIKYLKWLYRYNPCGRVIGYDAFVENQLVAHYACIPVNLKLHHNKVKGLLSLNTATLTAFQGQGLFTKLATLTYKAALKENYSCVYGVANTNSTPGFIRKLGFQLVTPLDVKVGVGDYKINLRKLDHIVQFRRDWTKESLEWRIKNPANLVSLTTHQDEISAFSRTGQPFISSYSPVLIDDYQATPLSVTQSSIRLFLGKLPTSTTRCGFFIAVPNALKPSPLNLIYKPLSSTIRTINKNRILISFLDFDAY